MPTLTDQTWTWTLVTGLPSVSIPTPRTREGKAPWQSCPGQVPRETCGRLPLPPALPRLNPSPSHGQLGRFCV